LQLTGKISFKLDSNSNLLLQYSHISMCTGRTDFT